MIEPTLGLPEAPDEPKPWRVRVDRHRIAAYEPFATREDAVAFAASLAGSDECYVVGILAPGSEKIDRAATLEAIPWRTK